MHSAPALQLLQDLVSIRSVSCDPSYSAEMDRAVALLSEVLSRLGFTVTTHSITHCPPMIYARRMISPSAETVGIYGHYDVQPAESADGWSHPPFSLTRRKGSFYGRGVADNKGHIVQHTIALQALIEHHELDKNIVMILEGEEETGSPHLEALLKGIDQSQLDQADVWLVTDVGSASLRRPQIFNALRGVFTGELTLRTSRKDAHSGVFGNRLYNPAHILAHIISSIHDPTTGIVTIPGFYEDIIPPSDGEYEHLVAGADTVEALQARSGAHILPPVYISYPNLPPNMPRALASKLAPSFDINGLSSGYTGEGSKTIIPAYATMKFSCRTVAGQSTDCILSLVERYLLSCIPEGITHELSLSAGCDPFYTAVSDPWMRRVDDVLSSYAGYPVRYNRSGGSIPAATILTRLFKRPVILTGFTLPGDNIHASDENFNEEMFWWGIGALERIYRTSDNQK